MYAFYRPFRSWYTLGMRYFLPLLFLVACTTPEPHGELHRGAYRPVRPPAFSPAQDAPHTTGQPGHLRQPPQRSPHRRALPPSREPGLWGGEAPQAAIPAGEPILYGITLPYFDTAETTDDRRITRVCANEMAAMSSAAGLTQLVLKHFSHAEQRCLAGRLYAECAAQLRRVYETRREKFLMMDKDFERRLAKTQAAAVAFRKSACDDVWINRAQDDAFDTMRATLRATLTAEEFIKEFGQ